MHAISVSSRSRKTAGLMPKNRRTAALVPESLASILKTHVCGIP